MATTAIGLDLGSTAVRAVQLAGGRSGPRALERLGQVLLPPGAVRDGEIEQPEVVATALRELWQRFGFTGRRVVLGVANQQVVVRQLDLPYQSPAQLRASLPLQVEDQLPISVADAVLDHQVLSEWHTADGQPMLKLLVVAATRAMVQTRLEVLRRARLQPDRLDLDAFAMLRSLSSVAVPVGEAAATAPAEDEGELVVVIGGGITNIVIHSGGAPRFVRILVMGGAVITETLQTVMGMTHEEAEAAKAAPEEHGDEVERIVRERTARFVDEIRGSLDYYRAQAGSVQVERLILSGGGSLLRGLPERLQQAVGLSVEPGHPLQSVRVGRIGLPMEELTEAEPFLAVPVGLALGAGP